MGRPDLSDESVNGVITIIPLGLHYKQEVTKKAALTFVASSPSSSFTSFICLSVSCSVFHWGRVTLGLIHKSVCVSVCVCV